MCAFISQFSFDGAAKKRAGSVICVLENVSNQKKSLRLINSDSVKHTSLSKIIHNSDFDQLLVSCQFITWTPSHAGILMVDFEMTLNTLSVFTHGFSLIIANSTLRLGNFRCSYGRSLVCSAKLPMSRLTLTRLCGLQQFVVLK